MSRHRNIQNYYDEYDDYEDDYYESGSDGGSFGTSPSLEKYMYRHKLQQKNSAQQKSKAIAAHEEEFEEDDYEYIEEALQTMTISMPNIQKKFTMEEIENAIRSHDYKAEAALKSLASKQKSKLQPVGGGQKTINIGAAKGAKANAPRKKSQNDEVEGIHKKNEDNGILMNTFGRGQNLNNSGFSPPSGRGTSFFSAGRGRGLSFGRGRGSTFTSPSHQNYIHQVTPSNEEIDNDSDHNDNDDNNDDDNDSDDNEDDDNDNDNDDNDNINEEKDVNSNIDDDIDSDNGEYDGVSNIEDKNKLGEEKDGKEINIHEQITNQNLDSDAASDLESMSEEDIESSECLDIDLTSHLDQPSSSASIFSQCLSSSLINQNHIHDEIYKNFFSPSCYKIDIFTFEEPSPDDIAEAARGNTVTMKQNLVEPFKPIVKAEIKANSRQTPEKVLATPSKTVKATAQGKTKKEAIPIDAEKSRLNIVIIGHVDAGKSTLMGHLLVQVGTVSDKVIHKYKKESQEIGKSSFAYAWVMDEHSEERSRGVTMDIGIRYFETKHKLVTILDAPGHKDFIPNMITGAVQADIAVLVVEATPGGFSFESQIGGPKEHLILVRSLGVSQILVAINKMDLVNWSKGAFDEIVTKLSPFLKQIGFQEQDIIFVPCSGLHGENLLSKFDKIPWYQGLSLLDELDKFEPIKREVEKPFRMSISDIYKTMASSVTVAGKIEGGHIKPNEKVMLMPIKEIGTVKSVLRHKKAVRVAFAGDTVEIGLNGIERQKISVGSVLCDPNDMIHCTNRFIARIVTFDPDIPITKGAEATLHIGHLNVPAVVSKLISVLNKNMEVARAKPRCLTKNMTAVVEVRAEKNLCVELYADYKAYGRFILRVGGKTIASGIVIELKKPKRVKQVVSLTTTSSDHQESDPTNPFI